MNKVFHKDSHMFFVFDPKSQETIGNSQGYPRIYHMRRTAERHFGSQGEIVEYAPVKYGINVTQMNPVDEFICSECGFISRDMSGYNCEDEVCYEFVPHYCPNCGVKLVSEER